MWDITIEEEHEDVINAAWWEVVGPEAMYHSIHPPESEQELKRVLELCDFDFDFYLISQWRSGNECEFYITTKKGIRNYRILFLRRKEFELEEHDWMKEGF